VETYNSGVPDHVPSDAERATASDPSGLLERAWELETEGRQAERTATLDQLERVLAAGEARPAPTGRSWELELRAERALDAPAIATQLSVALLEETIALADAIRREAGPAREIAIARAMFARGRALAWIGTDKATREADLCLGDAAERFAVLGRSEWCGYSTFWRGYNVCFLSGDLPRAATLIGEALEILGPGSPRRPMVLSFHADALVALGELDAAERAIAEGKELVTLQRDRKARSYLAWTHAKLAAARGDADGVELMLREVERDWGDWANSHGGGAFELDAADLLDRLGRSREAEGYLARALARGPEEWLQMTRATITARSGDPRLAIEELQRLARGNWLERRLLWRHTLLMAWATFRAGREGAGELAARALEQAVACGGVRVAVAGERELVAALAPLAERAGSGHARELMLDGRPVLIRLFGTPAAVRADGTAVELPAGQRGELVRMLAVNPRGLPVDVVLATFFPDAHGATARHRLRQLLSSLRSAVGELVVRDGEQLRLVPAWVDVREFLAAADRVRRTRGPRAVRLAYTALAVCTGPLLPTDPYASWTDEIRARIAEAQLALLDLIAGDAAARGSHQEALTALDAALEHDPDDGRRRVARARHLAALGPPASEDAAPATSDVIGRAPGAPPEADSRSKRAGEATIEVALGDGDELLWRGEWNAAERVLVGAAELAHRAGDRGAGARVRWSLARVAAGRGDVLLTERLLREAEHDATRCLDARTATAFLVDAAEQLDRLGLPSEAADFLMRAVERAGATDPAVRRGTAVLLARSGHPARALAALHEIAPTETADPRSAWRHTLLTAWAALRAGRGGAGVLAARALDEAAGSGGLDVAIAGEPELVLALAPIAEGAESTLARSLLLGNCSLLVRLFGAPTITRADGGPVSLPGGRPGELVRMLAVHEHGLAVDVVLEAFFPDAPLSSARHRLRQVLTRLRSAAGEIVVRDQDHLRLIPAWVDLREFLVAGDRVRGLHGPRAVRLTHAALAHHSGPLLPLDVTAKWADEARDRAGRRRRALLDLIADDAAARGWDSDSQAVGVTQGATLGYTC